MVIVNIYTYRIFRTRLSSGIDHVAFAGLVEAETFSAKLVEVGTPLVGS